LIIFLISFTVHSFPSHYSAAALFYRIVAATISLSSSNQIAKTIPLGLPQQLDLSLPGCQIIDFTQNHVEPPDFPSAHIDGGRVKKTQDLRKNVPRWVLKPDKNTASDILVNSKLGMAQLEGKRRPALS